MCLLYLCCIEFIREAIRVEKKSNEWKFPFHFPDPIRPEIQIFYFDVFPKQINRDSCLAAMMIGRAAAAERWTM